MSLGLLIVVSTFVVPVVVSSVEPLFVELLLRSPESRVAGRALAARVCDTAVVRK